MRKVREGLSNLMTFEQRLKGCKDISYVCMWKNSDPVRKNNKCKVPKMELCLMCSRIRKKDSVTGI